MRASTLFHTIVHLTSLISTGIIKLKNNGDFFIANEGRRPIYIDGRPVLCGSKWRLSNNSVVEVSWKGGGRWKARRWDGIGPVFYSPELPFYLAHRLPACGLSSSSIRTLLPLSGLRLLRSHHSEE